MSRRPGNWLGALIFWVTLIVYVAFIYPDLPYH
jgi:hypothetical protein